MNDETIRLLLRLVIDLRQDVHAMHLALLHYGIVNDHQLSITTECSAALCDIARTAGDDLATLDHEGLYELLRSRDPRINPLK